MRIEKISDSLRESFVIGLQKAFTESVVERFGDDGREVISHKEIEETMDAPDAQTFVATKNGELLGGCVVSVHPDLLTGNIELLYVRTDIHSRGVGFALWQFVERRFPKVAVWQLITPYFAKRNIHFYVNKCGFKIVEFFCPMHQDPKHPIPKDSDRPDFECYFRFEKRIEARE